MECVLRYLLNATLICTVKTCKTFARTIHRCASDSSYSLHNIFGLDRVLLCIYWEISSDSSLDRTTKVYMQITGQPIRPICASECNISQKYVQTAWMCVSYFYVACAGPDLPVHILEGPQHQNLPKVVTYREEVNNKMCRCTITLEK